ncbi:hypothetical protein [Stenotrophomonas sp. S41]|uniref:hypothetical protein n=1 Tax=Stenotrophomonas sp. S41 TaxID=2767464 RepID=UPI00190ACCD3|nr:hypothetical protein [Stenotrophomonas sp. S41]MBK0013249.1 hypothetical protein [Stenotrophomonas sp. S41]
MRALEPRVDYIAKVFADGAYRPRVYLEADVIKRYGKGAETVDQNGLVRRVYRDATSGCEVVITSNPDVAPEFRTVDEIRVSSLSSGKGNAGTVEGVGAIALNGVRIGGPAAAVQKIASQAATKESVQDRLGGVVVERTCIFLEGGSSNCYFLREGKVVALAVGFGP